MKKNSNGTAIKNRNVLAWLWQVTGRSKGCIGGLVILQAGLSGSGVIAAFLFRRLVDGASSGVPNDFWTAALMLAGLYIGENILGMLIRLLYEWINALLENRLKKRLFFCLLHKDYASVTAVHSGDWISRLTSDTAIVSNGLVDILPGLAGMASRLTGALIALFFLEPAFFYILIPIGCLMILATSSLRKVLKNLHRKIQEANDAVLSFLQEHVENLMIIRLFSMESKTAGAASQRMEQHKAARIKRSFFSSLCNFGFGILVDCGYLMSAAYCGYGILRGKISYGTFTAILQLVGQVQAPFANITGIVPQYYAMVASAERLMEVETYTEDQNDAVIPMDKISSFYQNQFESIGVKNASFSYQNYTNSELETEKLHVIQRVNLEIHKGEYIAFTGHSGCGKSTLLKLLMCLYPLDAGERYIKFVKPDGKVAKCPLTASWRRLFAYVPQGNQLMSGTIREIVAFGDSEAMTQDKRLEQALQIACADEFVQTLKKGIDTPLGERGSGLSEGQMQRIAIARAIFSDRPILILDESTSALDEITEQKVLANLRQMTEKTVLIITHRPAALKICDRQIEMLENKIQS